ncbi:MAG: efflux RND transporter periplasmic adaptor subunit [Roseitalea sp.]|nr:efflux RND transporter periplasmic adaptor subunit [Roseitalea sp.]MBO6721621.1 efflux RND transporter periplasmic adaptor subunit [Roseitalea sp.]MBO6743377.1 efflux RND transporter periplasmic adaptor subunit [Roseitalea sp.]
MADTSTSNSAAPRRRWLWIILSLVVLAAVIVLVLEAEDTADVTMVDTAPPAPAVTIVEVMPAEAIATVTAFGELRPRWDAEIRAAVSGRIVNVRDAALTGERVQADTLLFAIEKTQYETAVAAAELGVEEAKLALWRAENAVALARREFERTGTEPPNELALRLPELRIAERAVVSAEAQLQAARRQLADTEVMAPFSGFVTKRMASLGQTVSAGEALVHLSDDRHYEVTVELGQTDWALLDHPVAGTAVRLFHRDGTPLGTAKIRQGGGFLDPQTRQRRIFLDVTDPGDGVLAGDFVKVAFKGRPIADTLTVPESALTRAGHVWMVDADNLLVRMRPDILFRTDYALTIAAPDARGTARVAVTPLASFLPGQRVTPAKTDQ